MKYSIVVPIYTDGALAQDFCKETQRTFAAYLGRDDIEDSVEVVFVDDGSRNDSPRLLEGARRSTQLTIHGDELDVSTGKEIVGDPDGSVALSAVRLNSSR
jgi:hypothetical protein